MSLVAPAAHAARAAAGIAPRRVGDVVLWLAVFSGAVVMFEPAPYDLVMVALAAVSFILGLPLRRELAPLIVLLILFNVGGLIALAMVPHPWNKEPTFVSISFFLAGTCIYIAAACTDRPQRLGLVMNATIAAALLAAVLGIVGYFLHIESLALYGRAKGAFKDPNVLGPFLALPTAWLARELLTRPLVRVWGKTLPLLILLAGVFFTFSRAAWGLAAFSLVAVAFVAFVNERRPQGRLKIIGLASVGAVLLALLLLAILSIDSVRDLFAERAKLVQDYDGARLGRFARHLLGFAWSMELPLGLGPYQWAKYFPEDPHNVYLKVLVTYGWLGFLAYVTLAVWTLCALFPLMFKPGPRQGLAQVVFVVLLGHQAMSWVIDSDHWRHFFILWALAWTIIARDRIERRRPPARQGCDRAALSVQSPWPETARAGLRPYHGSVWWRIGVACDSRRVI